MQAAVIEARRALQGLDGPLPLNVVVGNQIQHAPLFKHKEGAHAGAQHVLECVIDVTVWADSDRTLARGVRHCGQVRFVRSQSRQVGHRTLRDHGRRTGV